MLRIITFIIFLSPVLAYGLDLMGATGTLAIAAAVQKAVSDGQYAFVAVVVLMFGMQIAKMAFGRKFKSVRRNTSQLSAIGGSLVGGAMSYATGNDPVAGSVGGLMAGNAASGLYSSIVKPISKFVFPKIFGGALWYLPVIAIAGTGAYWGISKLVLSSPKEKRQKMLSEFDDAMIKVKDKENPSTLELEEWITKIL